MCIKYTPSCEQLLIKASISLVFVWESFFALSEWIRGISFGGYLLSSSVRRPSQPTISWSASLHHEVLAVALRTVRSL